MGKKGSKKQADDSSRLTKLQGKIAQAQEDLQRAQDKRVRVMRRGEDDVEKARIRSAKRLAVATARLEKKSMTLSRLEQRALEVSRSPHDAGGGRSTMPDRDQRARDIGPTHDDGSPTIVLPDGHNGLGQAENRDNPFPPGDGAHS